MCNSVPASLPKQRPKRVGNDREFWLSPVREKKGIGHLIDHFWQIRIILRKLTLHQSFSIDFNQESTVFCVSFWSLVVLRLKIYKKKLISVRDRSLKKPKQPILFSYVLIDCSRKKLQPAGYFRSEIGRRWSSFTKENDQAFGQT